MSAGRGMFSKKGIPLSVRQGWKEAVKTETTTTTTTTIVERVSPSKNELKTRIAELDAQIQALQKQVAEQTTRAEEEKESRKQASTRYRAEIARLKERHKKEVEEFVSAQEDDPEKDRCCICGRRHISKRNQTRAMKRCYFKRNPNKTEHDLKTEYPGKKWDCNR